MYHHALSAKRSLRVGAHPLMLYSPAQNAFREVIDASPSALVQAGLYGPLAVEWHDGMLHGVSMRLAAKALGAEVGRPHGKGRGGCVAAVSRVGAAVGALCDRMSRQQRESQADGGTLLSRARPIVLRGDGDQVEHGCAQGAQEAL